MTTIDSQFLHGVHRDLGGLAAQLEAQGLEARLVLKSLDQDIADGGANWTGPRSVEVTAKANAYLADVTDYPEVVDSARLTITRWAGEALGTAEAMERLEPLVPLVRGPFEHDVDGTIEEAEQKIDTLRAEWSRSCTLYADGLSGHITALLSINAATSVPIDKYEAERLKAQLDRHNLAGPYSVRAWWASLTDEQRLALIATYPTLGNFAGIPLRSRDMALERWGDFETMSPAEKDRLARLFAPELRFHPDEPNMPIDPLELLKDGDLAGGRLDIDDDQHGGDRGSTPLLYEFIEDEDGNTYIRYWLGYGHNDGPGYQNHEGDWESIEVKISDPDGDGNYRGDSVAYSGHHTPTYRDWDEVPRNENGRPIVYVARGSHAHYPTDGDWNTDLGEPDEVPDWASDIVEDHARRGGSRLDLADQPGRDITREPYWNNDIENWGEDSPWPEETGKWAYDMTDGTKTPYGRRPLHQHSELSEEYPDEPNGVVPDLPFDLPDLPDPGDWPDIPMPNPPAIPDIPDLDPRNLDW